MGAFSLWLTSLAVSLVFVALASARSSRYQRRWLRFLVPALVALPPLFVGGLATVTGLFLLTSNTTGAHMFGWSLTWTVLVLAGSVLLALAAGGVLRWKGVPLTTREWSRAGLAKTLAACFAALVVTIMYLDLSAATYLAGMRAEAIAVTTSLAGPKVPYHENAAPLYERAFEILGDPETWPEARKKYRYACSEADLDAGAPEIRVFLREKGPALKLLREAASMPRCYIEQDHVHPYLYKLTLRKWRTASGLLGLAARHRAAKGDSLGAVRDITAIWSMAAHLSTSPQLLDLMVVMAIEGLGCGVLEDVLAETKTLHSEVIALRAVRRPGLRELLLRAHRYDEAAFMIYMADLPAAYNRSAHLFTLAIPAQPAYNLFFALFGKADIYAFTRWHARINQATDRTGVRTCKRLKELEKEFEENKGGIFTAMALSSAFNVATPTFKLEAMRRLAELGLAAELYRSAHGSYPSALGDLVPEYVDLVPTDPMDGRPLRMSAVDGGLVLYSVGLNGKDDGGRDANRYSPDAETDDDITFCLGSAYKERRLEPARRAAERRKKRERHTTSKAKETK